MRSFSRPRKPWPRRCSIFCAVRSRFERRSDRRTPPRRCRRRASAAGDLGVLIASRYGKISIVTPLTGAYSLVTLAFAALVLRERIMLLQWSCIVAILIGMFLCTS